MEALKALWLSLLCLNILMHTILWWLTNTLSLICTGKWSRQSTVSQALGSICCWKIAKLSVFLGISGFLRYWMFLLLLSWSSFVCSYFCKVISAGKISESWWIHSWILGCLCGGVYVAHLCRMETAMSHLETPLGSLQCSPSLSSILEASSVVRVRCPVCLTSWMWVCGTLVLTFLTIETNRDDWVLTEGSASQIFPPKHSSWEMKNKCSAEYLTLRAVSLMVYVLSLGDFSFHFKI